MLNLKPPRHTPTLRNPAVGGFSVAHVTLRLSLCLQGVRARVPCSGSAVSLSIGGAQEADLERLARENGTDQWSRGKIPPSWCVPPESLGAHRGRGVLHAPFERHRPAQGRDRRAGAHGAALIQEGRRMIGRTIVVKRKSKGEAEKPFWISYADLMTALTCRSR